MENVANELPRDQSRIEDVPQELPRLALSFTPRILLAEDSTETQIVLGHLFDRIGLDITVTSDGESCVDSAVLAMKEGKAFDAIFVDIYMPGINGHEVARRLREFGYEGPLIAITGTPSLATRCTCVHSGFDHFLAKSSLAHTIVPALKIYLNG